MPPREAVAGGGRTGVPRPEGSLLTVMGGGCPVEFRRVRLTVGAESGGCAHGRPVADLSVLGAV